MEGPTQTAKLDGAERWRSRPVVAFILRALVLIVPIALAIGVSFWVAVAFPPAELGLHVVVWWILLAVLSTAVMIITDDCARRFLPLAALMKLSLVFPDEAPSRFKQSLRKGTTRQLAKELKHFEEHGSFHEFHSQAEYVIELARLISAHDSLTRGHSERVRAYTAMIAEELDLPTEDREKLQWAALLHDAGKLHVPGEILNKDGKPDAEEWEILKAHPAAGEQYLAPLADWLGEWRMAASEHHLRWDGHGYPKSIGGTDISYAGRIVAIADAYDVMTSLRSYKTPMPVADARAEIASCSGGQFDPAVVRAFLNIGMRRFHAPMGPLGWIGHTLGLNTASIGAVATPLVTTVGVTAQLAIAGIAAVGGIALAEQVTPPKPPPAVAFVDEAPVVSTLVDRPLGVAATSTPPAFSGEATAPDLIRPAGLVTSTAPGDTSTTIAPETGQLPAGSKSQLPFAQRSTTSAAPATTTTPTTTTSAVPTTTASSTAPSTTTTTSAPSTTTAAPTTTSSSTAPTTSSTTTTSTTSTTSSTTTTSTTSTTTSTTTTTIPLGECPADPGCPSVTDDSYTRAKGEPQGNLNVLTNDWTTGESFLNILTLSVVTPPTNDVDADFEAHIGHFHYTAQPNFVGVDTFTYEICNYDGFCDIATVTVTVTP